VVAFKETLKATRKAKKEIWRRVKPGAESETEYFSEFCQ
jgi:hypothetical protein